MQKILLMTLFFVSGCSNIAQTPDPTNHAIDQGQTFAIYFYIPGDNGVQGELLGCGDSLTSIDYTLYRYDDPLPLAINALLEVQDSVYEPFGLANALANSSISLDAIVYDTGSNMTYIALVGTVSLGGMCDNPRFAEQINRTIGQFFPLHNFVVTINGEVIDSFLSLQ